MNRRIVVALAGTLLVSSGTAEAQSGTNAAVQGTAVAITVPLNLTQLSPDLGRIRVTCVVIFPPAYGALGASPEVDVSSDGSVVTTVTVYVAVNVPVSAGTSSGYECNLQGFSKGQQDWFRLSPAQSGTNIAHLRLSPILMPVGGTITW